MKSILHLLSIIFLLCSLTGVSYANVNNNVNVDDIKIKTKILTIYSLNPQLNPFDFDINVDNGIVTINGTVANSAEKDLAIDLARGIEGVNKVNDNIKADQKAVRNANNTSFLQKVDDATTTAAVKSKLLLNRNTSGLNIHVSTVNGVVTLDGDVASSAEKHSAEQIAKQVNGVRKVINHLKSA